MIQHAAIYAGVPAANHAFKVAAPILEELRRHRRDAPEGHSWRDVPPRRTLPSKGTGHSGG